MPKPPKTIYKTQDRAPLEPHLNRVLSPFDQFLRSQYATGVLLITATIIALVLANSGYSEFYQSIGHLPLGFFLGDLNIQHSLHTWCNDGLMVFYFFLLGMEIKRERLAGGLRDIRQASLIIFMAIGGMLVPALIFTLFNYHATSINGWGIPMATDTAFALGVLALLGTRAPKAAALLLSALAIVDDMGAVLIIGLFYTDHLNFSMFISVIIALSGLFLLNRSGVRLPLPYLIFGIFLWWSVLQSGVHATVAGVLAALAIPVRPKTKTRWFIRKMRSLIARFEAIDRPDKSILEQNRQHEMVEKALDIARSTTTPVQHWSSALDRPISLAIIPLFAFLNAGVALPSNPMSLLNSSTMLGVTAGLVLGKAFGICSMAWLSTRLGIASLPEGMRFIHIVGLSFLAGIGFTMALFIATLAFEHQSQLLAEAKLGILLGSAIAGAAGIFVFLWANKRQFESDNKTQSLEY